MSPEDQAGRSGAAVAEPKAGTPDGQPNLQRVELSVARLACPSEAGPLAARLKQLPGVREAIVNPVTERAVVLFDSGTIGTEAIIEFLGKWGLDVGRTVGRWWLRIPGLTCGSCARRIEEAVRAISGVSQAFVNLAAETLAIEYSPKKTDLRAIRTAVRAQGFDPGRAVVE